MERNLISWEGSVDSQETLFTVLNIREAQPSGNKDKVHPSLPQSGEIGSMYREETRWQAHSSSSNLEDLTPTPTNLHTWTLCIKMILLSKDCVQNLIFIILGVSPITVNNGHYELPFPNKVCSKFPRIKYYITDSRVKCKEENTKTFQCRTNPFSKLCRDDRDEFPQLSQLKCYKKLIAKSWIFQQVLTQKFRR